MCSAKGNTVIRGGWGRFYYHSGQFTNGLDVAAGVQSISFGSNVNGNPLMANQLDTLNFTTQALSPAAVDSKDDRQPYTDSYSFTISQRLPWASLLEVAYVGNQSKDLRSEQRRRQQYQPGSGGRDAGEQERRRGSEQPHGE